MKYPFVLHYLSSIYKQLFGRLSEGSGVFYYVTRRLTDGLPAVPSTLRRPALHFHASYSSVTHLY